jgi:hypothetical protein
MPIEALGLLIRIHKIHHVTSNHAKPYRVETPIEATEASIGVRASNRKNTGILYYRSRIALLIKKYRSTVLVSRDECELHGLSVEPPTPEKRPGCLGWLAASSTIAALGSMIWPIS